MSRKRQLAAELIEQESDDVELDVLQLCIASQVSSALGSVGNPCFGGSRVGKRPNRNRNWQQAEERLRADYFAEDSVYDDAAFRRRFRITKTRFLSILHDMSTDEFMKQRIDAAGVVGAPTMLKMTAALRVLGHATSTDIFDDYVRMSESSINECVKHYCMAVVRLYESTYLRGPTSEEVARIVSENDARGFPGMFGSVDCFSWEWQNCPTAWKGQYLGKEGKPTVIAQAVADKSMRIWDLNFGCPGNNNDITVLHRSGLTDKFAAEDSIFKFNYTVGENSYDTCYVLGDGIYPEYSFIVKAYRSPITQTQQLFTRRQESVRKDIERTFGVLRFQWLYLMKPCRLWYVEDMHTVVKACAIMHNMNREDRLAWATADSDSCDEEENDTAPERQSQTGEVTDDTEEEATDDFSVLMRQFGGVYSKESHLKLRADLTQELWSREGNRGDHH
eukprot:GHVU01104954.1.p1 GENE.GHVU01104954.1~~GHVU01104954.1.p1  ORF type:complete len:448 (-),score=44.78 GHVU01104954.1:134-1477(-)